jgi:hypothetical protein
MYVADITSDLSGAKKLLRSMYSADINYIILNVVRT